MSQMLHIADLFCGAGGTSTGAVEAARALGMHPQLTAVNHWPVAVRTHEANHPEARHFCASLDALNPRELFRPGQLDLLWASPECTHHSVARGGRPINEQSRATAWCVVRWAEALMPPVIMVENVPEFVTWGGIGGPDSPFGCGEYLHLSFRCMADGEDGWSHETTTRFFCPVAVPGDRLWVRETYLRAARGGIYRADMPEIEAAGMGALYGGWKSPRFMPKAAARLWLEVTEVRLARIQEISRGDCMAEGCPFPNMQDADPRGWFRDLWESINGPGSWEDNPWVWVIEFRRVK